MYIRNLVEDTCCREGLQGEHGLSFYIETEKHKILFDTGASDLFMKNANIMGIDLSVVDTVVISHGHYDHGGGITSFLKENRRAFVFMRKEAFGKHYSKRGADFVYIGLPEDLTGSSRMIYPNQELMSDGQWYLFSSSTEKELWPEANHSLFTFQDGEYILDDFLHEQSLLLVEKGKRILFCGCAHRGIVNIIECAHSLFGSYPDVVIGGFHLANPRQPEQLNRQLAEKTAQKLSQYPCKYYTCHCTGMEAFSILKQTLGHRISLVQTGDEICVDN